MERDTVSLQCSFFMTMPFQSGPNHGEQIDIALLETWAKGWSLTRDIAAPVSDSGGLRIDVGWPEQKTRYLFAALTEGFLQLAHAITEPYVFLKICLPAEDVSQHLPSRWTIQAPRFLMTCGKTMKVIKHTLPEGYALAIEETLPVSIVKIFTACGELAAIGRIAIVDNHAIYDRIETYPGHRRKGLATAVMLALEAIAVRRKGNKGILIATAQGRALYETLGWQVRSAYTTAVIFPHTI